MPKTQKPAGKCPRRAGSANIFSFKANAVNEEEEEEEEDEEEDKEGLFKANAVNEEDPERNRATQV